MELFMTILAMDLVPAALASQFVEDVGMALGTLADGQHLGSLLIK